MRRGGYEEIVLSFGWGFSFVCADSLAAEACLGHEREKLLALAELLFARGLLGLWLMMSWHDFWCLYV